MNIPTPFDSESPSAHEYELDVMNIIYRRLDWLSAQGPVPFHSALSFIDCCWNILLILPPPLPSPPPTYLSSVCSVHSAWLLPCSLFLPLGTVCFICCKAFSSSCPILICYTAPSCGWHRNHGTTPSVTSKIFAWIQLLSGLMLNKKRVSWMPASSSMKYWRLVRSILTFDRAQRADI